MSENLDGNFSTGVAEGFRLVPIGPLESRRIRRKRLESAEASLASPLESRGSSSTEDAPARTTVVFFDELAAARHRKLMAWESSERSQSPDDDLVS